jgi:hypothetical protein
MRLRAHSQLARHRIERQANINAPPGIDDKRDRRAGPVGGVEDGGPREGLPVLVEECCEAPDAHRWRAG